MLCFGLQDILSDVHSCLLESAYFASPAHSFRFPHVILKISFKRLPRRRNFLTSIAFEKECQLYLFQVLSLYPYRTCRIQTFAITNPVLIEFYHRSDPSLHVFLYIWFRSSFCLLDKICLRGLRIVVQECSGNFKMSFLPVNRCHCHQ